MAEITVQIQVVGGPSLEAAMRRAMDQVGDIMEGVMFEEGQEIIDASKEIVPLDQGDLRATGGYYGTERTPEGRFHRFGYNTAYAVIQHETPPHIFSHLPGRQWKYLEVPIFEAVTTMPARLGARASARLAARFSGSGAGTGASGTFGGDE